MQVRQASKDELASELGRRDRAAGRAEKGRLLDEYVGLSGFHRKYALTRLHTAPTADRRPRGGGRPVVYGTEVLGGLRVAAEATGWICGKRLAPILPELVAALQREGALALAPAGCGALTGMSAATIDRRLRQLRQAAKPHGLATTKPGSLLRRQIPVRTSTPWNEQQPGFVEIDLVAHCGTTTAGTYLSTLTLVDIATGWTECTPVATKTQDAVYAALCRLREVLPFPLLGIDSDNGSEFINERLLRWCQREQLTFTRCRPYHKNDQAHVEGKNWSVVRREIGYDRYESAAALRQLGRVYELLRVQTNGVLPTMKLVAKEREGARVRKHYDVPKTAYQRAREAGVVSAEAQARFDARLTERGPLGRRRSIDAEVERLWSLRVGGERTADAAAADAAR